jgi:hypothetical protein
MAVELLSFSAYARHRGCDEKAVRKAVAQARITAIERHGRRLIDPEVADIQWAKNTRARVRPKAPAAATSAPGQGAMLAAGTSSASGAATAAAAPPVLTNYDSAKTRQAIADAMRAELEVGRMAGRLVDRGRAERAAFDAFRELRDAIFAAAKSQARKVIGLSDVREVELAIEDELRVAFDGWEQRTAARIAEAACS